MNFFDHFNRRLNVYQATQPSGKQSLARFAASVGITEHELRQLRKGKLVPKKDVFQAIVDAFFGSSASLYQERLAFTAAYGKLADTRTQEPRRTSAKTTVRRAIIQKPERLIGRDQVLDQLREHLLAEIVRPVIILGGPGFGKTTVTVGLATDQRIVTRFGDRRWVVSLETATDALSMRAGIAHALGLPRTASLTAIDHALSSSPALLVLDNLETPFEGVAGREAVKELLSALGRNDKLAILASMRGTRNPGGLRWRDFQLPPIADEDSASLLLDIAQNITSDDPDLNALLQALGGIPLAIELVARRVAGARHLKPFWREWQLIGGELASRPDGRIHRLDSLPISIELSARSPTMSKAASALFALLGRLPAGLGMDDGRTLIGSGYGRAAEDIVTAGLAHWRIDRIETLPPIRDHAYRYHLLDEASQGAWIKHFLALVATCGEQIGKAAGDVSRQRLIADDGNVEAALVEATRLALITDALRAVEGYTRLVRLTAAASPEPLYHLADVVASSGDLAAHALIQRCIGEITLIRSRHDRSDAAFRQALAAYGQLDDRIGQARCWRGLGDLKMEQGNYRGARRDLYRALVHSRRVESLLEDAECLTRLARIDLELNQWDRATARFEQALDSYRATFRQTGEAVGWANCLFRLAELSRFAKKFEPALERYEEAANLYARAGADLGVANCIKGRGDVALASGQSASAAAAFDNARRMYESLGAIINTGNAWRGLGDCAAQREDSDAARAFWLKGLGLYEAMKDSPDMASIYIRLARATTANDQRRQWCGLARSAWLAAERTDLIELYVVPIEADCTSKIYPMDGPF